ncbi:MAG: biopolymer transporter, partial [Synechocystis sp.]
QSSLEQTLKTLKEKATLEAVLEEIQATLQKLKPSLEQISKPRRLFCRQQFFRNRRNCHH